MATLSRQHSPADHRAVAGTVVADAVVRPEGASELSGFSQRMRALNSLSTQLVYATDREPPYAAMVEGVWRVAARGKNT